MTDATDTHERRFPTLAVVLCVVIVLPVIYVLSYGPALWLATHAYLSGDSFNFVYCPIEWSCRHSVTVSAFIGWYESLWVTVTVDGMQ